MTTAAVSIVIASFQYGRFLAEAIESALAQTIPVEIIVVDDGSTDESLEVARRYPVKTVTLDRGGVCRVRNRGAELATGRYLLFLDADDRLPSDYAERCLARLEAAGKKVAYVYTPMDRFGAETGRFASRPFDARALLRGNFVHVSALVHRDVFLQAGGFDPALRSGYEDYDLWLRLLDRGYEGVLLGDVALQYRRHASSRNSLSESQLRLLRRQLILRYPALHWRQFAAQPLAVARTWLSELFAEGDDTGAPPAPVDPQSERAKIDISVVVVNWNSKADLAACLRSLAVQSEQEFQVIVVDNGSTDGSVEMVREEFSSVTLVATGENLGFAEGCNRGIAVAEGEWVATLNNDAVAAPEWIAELRRAVAAGDPWLGMLQSKIVFRERTDRTNSTGVLLFGDASAKDRHYDVPVEEANAPAEIFCTSAGAALYRRRMLDETRLPSGVFDRTFFMYFEDVDLGWRCRLAGWQAVYVPSAIVLHAFHGSSKRRGRHFVALHCKRNRLRMLVKNGSGTLFLRGLPRTVADLLWLVRIDGSKAIEDYARALHDGLRQRAAVSLRARVLRRDIERRWVVRSGRA